MSRKMQRSGWKTVVAVVAVAALYLQTASAALPPVAPDVAEFDLGVGFTPASLAPGIDGGVCTPTADPVPAVLQRAGLVSYTEDTNGGEWKPWVVQVGDIAVPPPPATLSPQTAQELLELQALSLNRTGNDTIEALIWDNGPAHKSWTELYMSLIVEHASKSGKRNPPRLSREMALVHVAMYDALVTTYAAKYCYDRPAPYVLDPALQPVVEARPLPSYPSEHATVAGVMSVMLPELFPCPIPYPHPDCEEPTGSLESIAARAAASRLIGGGNYRSDVEVGFAVSQEVARRVLASRADDGAFDPPTRVRVNNTPCNWQPTPPGFRQNPLEPQWGDQRPWIMSTGSQFRVPPPPACDSQEYIAQYAQLYYKTGWNGTKLTQRQKDIAYFWEGGQGTVTPPGISTWEASNITATEGLTTLQAARLMSYVGVAVADAAIGVWDTKFTYWFDRPVTAINRLGASGVLPADAATWIPYLSTPPFPGYVSGHSGFSAAAYFTLAKFFPERLEEFRAKSSEAALSRYYGGIHFEADNERGIEIGTGIAGLLAARANSDNGPPQY